MASRDEAPLQVDTTEKVCEFVQRLYNMIEDPNDDSIVWWQDSEGSEYMIWIKDSDAFCRRMYPDRPLTDKKDLKKAWETVCRNMRNYGIKKIDRKGNQGKFVHYLGFFGPGGRDLARIKFVGNKKARSAVQEQPTIPRTFIAPNNDPQPMDTGDDPEFETREEQHSQSEGAIANHDPVMSSQVGSSRQASQWIPTASTLGNDYRSLGPNRSGGIAAVPRSRLPTVASHEGALSTALPQHETIDPAPPSRQPSVSIIQYPGATSPVPLPTDDAGACSTYEGLPSEPSPAHQTASPHAQWPQNSGPSTPPNNADLGAMLKQALARVSDLERLCESVVGTQGMLINSVSFQQKKINALEREVAQHWARENARRAEIGQQTTLYQPDRSQAPDCAMGNQSQAEEDQVRLNQDAMPIHDATLHPTTQPGSTAGEFDRHLQTPVDFSSSGVHKLSLGSQGSVDYRGTLPSMDSHVDPLDPYLAPLPFRFDPASVATSTEGTFTDVDPTNEGDPPGSSLFGKLADWWSQPSDPTIAHSPNAHNATGTVQLPGQVQGFGGPSASGRRRNDPATSVMRQAG